MVLAGGRGARLGGADKAALVVGGRALLKRALDAFADCERVVVVGPESATSRPVTWVREEPPGGGPVAGLAAGLAATRSELVAVLAVDLPLVDAGSIEKLQEAVGDRDGAILVDEAGRDQPLAGIYRRAALAAALAGVEVAGASMHSVTGRLTLTRIVDAVATQDCDVPEDVERIERQLAEVSPDG